MKTLSCNTNKIKRSEIKQGVNTENGGVVTVEYVAASTAANRAKGIGIGELEVGQITGLRKPNTS